MSTPGLTEQEFKEWSDDLQYIIWDCHISLQNFEALAKHLHRGAEWIPISGFLDHLRTQYYFTLVTQLAKLFCEGDHALRFTALMNRLAAPPVSSFVLGRLEHNTRDSIHARLPQFWKSEQEMRDGLKRLKQGIAKQKAVIERLHKCRNKVIAHTDSIQQRQSAEQAAPTVSELKELAKLAAEIHNLIQAGLGLGSFSFDTTGSWDIEPVFRGWSGHVELHNLKGELMRMGYAGLIALDRASFDLKVVPLPQTGE
jgi:hypothetical protein